MKIVFVANVFSEKTGYITNCLPKALAKLGHEVHVVAPNVQVYFNSPDYKKTYQNFLGPAEVSVGIKEIDGFILHRLPHGVYRTEAYIKGLYKKLKVLKPDVVQCFTVDSVIAYHLAFYKVLLNFKLFTANHILKSVFPLHHSWSKSSLLKKTYWNIRHFIPGRIVSYLSEKTYTQTIDSSEIAIDYFGVLKRKCVVDPLGVDTDFFMSLPDDSQLDLKIKYGFQKTDFICVYTGRFSEAKNPLLLARAIEQLQKTDKSIKGLFIGSGPQEKEIKKVEGVVVSGFVPFDELNEVYNTADIGVWPREDSTSMLDALACGLPIIVSDKVRATERISGCGLTYKENNVLDLANKIHGLVANKNEVKKMSKIGVDLIMSKYSWGKIAKERIKDYEIIS